MRTEEWQVRHIPDINRLRGRVPAIVLDELPGVIAYFSINTKPRLAHFLAQTAHESGRFKYVRENLSYSTTRLKAIFSKYFPTDEIRRKYAHNPQLIGNVAYANRIGNGPPESGDGYRYRGRGYIQVTGRANYAQFDKHVPEDIINNPDLVASKYPLLSAAWFWDSRRLNTIADRGVNDEVVTAVTKLVNGGTNGLHDRISLFHYYHSVLI